MLIRVEAGLQFGSRFVVSPVEGQVFDYLPPEMLDRVRNLETFAGSWRWISGLAMRTGGRRRSGGRCGSGNIRRRLSIRDIALMRGSGRFRIFRCGACIRGMKFMRR
jgi:hypothetical protein